LLKVTEYSRVQVFLSILSSSNRTGLLKCLRFQYTPHVSSVPLEDNLVLKYYIFFTANIESKSMTPSVEKTLLLLLIQTYTGILFTLLSYALLRHLCRSTVIITLFQLLIDTEAQFVGSGFIKIAVSLTLFLDSLVQLALSNRQDECAEDRGVQGALNRLRRTAKRNAKRAAWMTALRYPWLLVGLLGWWAWYFVRKQEV
jgi:hypothetical protein